ncbi:MAG TPA: MogA/MoaB family molybdenum cofactor biosynthesis protein [Solirubrobacterales bacterium]|jgi:molybdenum cofactor synthesis domain-containing protein|nr:MogA/MoaB family molybdenum cofactor biosynthesis protein [Solirubrobacterales bacterium]
MAEPSLRAVIVTVSSSRAEGSGEADASGAALAGAVEEMGGTVAGRELIGDHRDEIEACLRRWADGGECDLILTTGGTGLAPADVTPEATEAVLERRAPGIAEAMRAASAPHTRHWMLSRATAGARGRCLVVNFPGNPKAIQETAAVILPALPHAVSLLRSSPTPHRT